MKSAITFMLSWEIFENKKFSKQEAKERIDKWCENSEKYKTKAGIPPRF